MSNSFALGRGICPLSFSSLLNFVMVSLHLATKTGTAKAEDFEFSLQRVKSELKQLFGKDFERNSSDA